MEAANAPGRVGAALEPAARPAGGPRARAPAGVARRPARARGLRPRRALRARGRRRPGPAAWRWARAGPRSSWPTSVAPAAGRADPRPLRRAGGEDHPPGGAGRAAARGSPPSSCARPAPRRCATLPRRMGALSRSWRATPARCRSTGGFDAALVDPPCTGLGVLSARPDARWRRREEALGPLVGPAARPPGARAGAGAARRSGRLLDLHAHRRGERGRRARVRRAARRPGAPPYPDLAHPRLPGALLTLPAPPRHRRLLRRAAAGRGGAVTRGLPSAPRAAVADVGRHAAPRRAARRPARRRAPGSSTWTSWTATSSPTSPWARTSPRRRRADPRRRRARRRPPDGRAGPGRSSALFARGADAISVHYEADPTRTGSWPRSARAGCRAGLAVNPGTPLGARRRARRRARLRQLLSIDPGFAGQEFIPATPGQVARLRRAPPGAGRDRGRRRHRPGYAPARARRRREASSSRPPRSSARPTRWPRTASWRRWRAG